MKFSDVVLLDLKTCKSLNLYASVGMPLRLTDVLYKILMPTGWPQPQHLIFTQLLARLAPVTLRIEQTIKEQS